MSAQVKCKNCGHSCLFEEKILESEEHSGGTIPFPESGIHECDNCGHNMKLKDIQGQIRASIKDNLSNFLKIKQRCFSPYHRMAHCQRLQRTISEFHENGNIPELIFGQYKRYHYSLLHKLKSAKKHLENLQDVLENTEVSAVVGNSNDFINEVNMHIDSFFYCCGSAMDILAREVLIYYNIPLPNRVYFRTAREQINTLRPGDALLTRLQDPTWEQEFKDYRNSLTHEVLIWVQTLIYP